MNPGTPDLMNPELAWDERGLVPAVVQHARTGAVLMLAWMNAEAFAKTRATGFVHFYSRSRAALWMKGETSGNTLAVRELRIDCDADAVVVIAEPAGPTCHTGTTSCFYRLLDSDRAAGDTGSGDIIEDDGPAGPPAAIAAKLEAVLAARQSSTAQKSYTKSLFDAGFPKILAKIAEEHGELAAELPAGDPAAVVHETADLLFHVMVGLRARGVSIDDVWRELGRRFGVSGHQEKASRGQPG
jgi:phosphoribosyl-ATP pyrophosphohydrolase/phosphoribosyl-AMP cyclohydrolase